MKKKLFFAVEVHAPWPRKPLLPHLTLDFLGMAEVPDMKQFVPPKIPLGVAGIADQLLTLRHVLAYHVDFFSGKQRLTSLLNKELSLPHVTVTRDKTETIPFEPFPLITMSLHLFESPDHSLWNFSLLPPIEEFSHTADLAFYIRAATFPELYLNAQLALCWHHPEMLSEISHEPLSSLDEIIFALNDFISRVDMKFGAPYKAVSFHGKLTTTPFLTWEMIIDV